MEKCQKLLTEEMRVDWKEWESEEEERCTTNEKEQKEE
jgi:hypothetical protein